MRRLGLLITCVLFAAIANSRDDVQIIDILAGQQADVFFQINTTGKLYLKIVAQSGESCINLWWIKWPSNSVEQLGRKCGNVIIDTPDVPNGAQAARLRAGPANAHTKIAVFSDASVFAVPIRF
jgi:hypothetical protein